MNRQTQEVQTAVALATGAALATEVVMRMRRTQISGAIDGNKLTRTSMSVMSMNLITDELKRRREATPAVVQAIA